jgi:hypothetical protein
VTLVGSALSKTFSRRSPSRHLIEAKKEELERAISQALTSDVTADPIDADSSRKGEFQTDGPYRDEVMAYEQRHHRYPVLKGANQHGHDVDSYSHPEGDQDRRLLRRIEVKGRGTRWELNEVVDLSRIQFHAALNKEVSENVVRAIEFDYWLYVVDTDENGALHVHPIPNAAVQTARFSFRGGTWQYAVRHG